MSEYEIVSTVPTIYQERDNTVVNGVLVRFRILSYDEVHEVRVPKMDVSTVKTAIEKVITQRDELATLGSASK